MSQSFWFNSGKWLQCMKDYVSENLIATRDEKKILHELISHINFKVSSSWYTPELFLNDIAHIEEKIEEIEQ
jgi:hypothetical protein